MRNITFMHTARDDSILGTMRFISKHEDTQVYGSLLPKSMTNQAMLDSNSYKTYYAIATRAEPPKQKKIQKKSDSAISSKETPSKKKPNKAKKDVSPTRKLATKPKPTKKKELVKADRGKDEETGTKPGVPDVPKYDSESKKESWGDSGEEDDDDDEDESDDDKGNDDDGDNDDNDDDSADERTESNRNENPNLNQSSKEHEEEEYVDERVHTPKNYELTNEEDNANNTKEGNEEEKDDDEELYRDVNVNLRKEYVEMTDVDQGGADQHNKTEVDNEIASLMETTVRHEELSSQTSSLYIVPVTVILEIIFNDRVTNLEKDLSEIKKVDRYAQAISSIPAIVDRYIGNKLGEAIQQAIKSYTVECRNEALDDKREYIDLIDTSVRAIMKEEVNTQLPQILPQAESDFATPILWEPKIEEHKSYLRAEYKKELYDALVESYNTDKDLFETYGEVFTLKRSRDDKDKDQDPSVGSDQGMKKRKTSKDADSSRDLKSNESKSSSSSKVQQNQEFDTGNNDEQPDDEAAPKFDWFKKPKRPSTPDPDWNKRKYVDFRPPQTWISDIAHAEKPPTSFDELMDTLIDFSAFVMNRLNITNLTQELLGKQYPFSDLVSLSSDSRSSRSSSYPSGLLYQQRPRISERWKFKQKILNSRNKDKVTSLKIMKWYRCSFPRSSQNWRDLPRDNPLVSVEVLSRHGPSDAMHNPPQPLKVRKTLVSKLTGITLISIDFLTLRLLIFDEVFLALGWLLEKIHVTWAHLEKKRTRLRLYTKSLKKLCIQSVETASHVSSDGVRTFEVTVSDIW
ncbi:hypothetical protein Tco_0345635 [Tanacetum coccineum]